jgi:hypothetical protein
LRDQEEIMNRLRLHPENHLVGRIRLVESCGARGKRWNGALAMALTAGIGKLFGTAV